MAAYIASVAGLFATAGITKAWSEKYEKHDEYKRDNDKDSSRMDEGE